MTRRKNKPAAGAARPAEDGVFGAVPVLPEELALLALAAPVATPPPARVKARLLARIRAERQKAPAPAPAPAAAVPAGWRFVSARTSEGWRESFPGVRFKTLSVDDTRDVVMLLVEMAPGARFPDHPHDVSADEGVVISGDVNMDGRLMLPGDYYHAEIGTEHLNVTSPSGCTALLSLRATAWRQWQVSLTAR